MPLCGVHVLIMLPHNRKNKLVSLASIYSAETLKLLPESKKCHFVVSTYLRHCRTATEASDTLQAPLKGSCILINSLKKNVPNKNVPRLDAHEREHPDPTETNT